jgi:hypothetical protein
MATRTFYEEIGSIPHGELKSGSPAPFLVWVEDTGSGQRSWKLGLGPIVLAEARSFGGQTSSVGDSGIYVPWGLAGCAFILLLRVGRSRWRILISLTCLHLTLTVAWLAFSELSTWPLVAATVTNCLAVAVYVTVPVMPSKRQLA